MASADNCEKKLSKYWVNEVLGYSSQYGGTSWSANQIIGPPRAYPQYGDNSNVWTHANAGSPMEFLQLGFEEQIFITAIDLYETFHGGAVVKIELKTPAGGWKEVYSVESPTVVNMGRIFSPPLQATDFRTKEVKVTMDCSASHNWYELDAVQISGSTYRGAPAPSIAQLSHDLACMVNNSEFSDVTFQVDGKRIYGHKVLLAARCPYFRMKFNPADTYSTQSQEVVIQDVSHDAFLSLVEFLYTNTLNKQVSPDIIMDLLRFADAHCLDGLANFCNQRIFDSVDSENVVKLYRDAYEKSPPLETVKDVCIQYISHNMDKVCKTEDFRALPQNVMLDIIQQTVGNKQEK